MTTTTKGRLRLVSLLAVTLSVTAYGQTSGFLSMDKALEIAAKNSNTIQKAELDKRIAKYDRQQTDAIFLPQVSLGYNALFTNDPLNAFGFLLQQRQVSSADFNPSRLNNPDIARNYAASVDFQMPVFNMDKIYARKSAKLQEEVYEHQAEFTSTQVRFEVRKAYAQLQFAYQAKNILDSTLQDVKGIYRSVNDFYQQGILHKSDVLNAQVQVNTIETALSKAESNIRNASDGLRLLMGEDLSAESEAYLTAPLKPEIRSLEHQSFSSLRPDILAMKKAVEASKMQEKSSAMAFVPSINAFGSYKFNDDKVFRFKEDSYLLGITLKWTIFSGNLNRGKYKSSVYRSEKMQKDYDLYLNNSRIEVERNKRAIADWNLEIRKHRASVDQAYESLRIISDRHKEGLVNTTELLLAQAQHSQQKLALAQAVMNYNIACYYQEALTYSL